MDQNKSSLEDLQRAFATTTLEPEIPEATLIAYAAGRATVAETELVETMLAVDPSLADVIVAIQDELAAVGDPLPATKTSATQPQKSGWLNQLLPISRGILAAAACALLALAYLDRGRLMEDVKASDQRVAKAEDENKQSIVNLQQKISSLRKEIGSTKEEKQAIVAELDHTRKRLNRELAARANMNASQGGVESMVASAISKGISMPAIIDLGIGTRGAIELDLKMSPNETSVRKDVKLTWSGAPATDYRVQITGPDGQQIWKADVDRPEADPPAGLLKPGTTYAWQIAEGSKRGPIAEFRTCTAAEEKRASLIDKDRKLGPLEKGVVYADLGLVSDAEAEFKLLRASDPWLADKLTKELETLRK